MDFETAETTGGSNSAVVSTKCSRRTFVNEAYACLTPAIQKRLTFMNLGVHVRRFKRSVLLAIGCAMATLPAQAADISHQPLGNGGEAIFIVGDIRLGDDQKFAKLAVQFDKAIVTFSSDGGALLPALEIGRAIHLRGFNTAVLTGYQCASACALIWAAGANRFIQKGGRVGFHASYVRDGGRLAESGMANALVGRYLTLMDLPEKAILFATQSHPETIIWLSEEADATLSGMPFTFTAAHTTTSSPVDNAPKTSDSPYTVIDNWRVYRNQYNCGVMANYGDEILGFFVREKDQAVMVTFTDKNAKSLNDGDQRIISMILVKNDGSIDSGWKDQYFRMNIENGYRSFASKSLLNPALADLKTTVRLGFYYENKKIGIYNLIGLPQALAEAERCSERLTNASSLDVFAK